MPTITAKELIEIYGLERHPEGGYFKETYRAAGSAEFSGLGARNLSTAIYFLLEKGARSRLHRIKSDELWHFHLGGPLTVARILPDGNLEETVLGPDVKAGQRLQLAVPAGSWFGAYPCEGTEFSFVGCTVAPGFDFADFELARREELLARFPLAAGTITRLT
jgi:hypothetical protein